MDTKRIVGIGALALGGGVVALGLAIQLVPYGRDHTNPAVVAEPTWNAEATRDLAIRACYDCHSNETKWPAYSGVAPFSWAVSHHVEEGRSFLNFSEWNRPQEEAHEAAEVVAEGEMPPAYYTLLHPEARLTDAERQTLIDGLTATIGEGASEGAE